MNMKYKRVLYVLILLLIIQVSESSKRKRKVDSLEEDQDSESIDEKVKIQQDKMEPINVIRRQFIHNEKTKLTHDQKNIVYGGLYPIVSQYCNSNKSIITRLITAFLWSPLPKGSVLTIPKDRPAEICLLSSDDTWLVSQNGLYDISLWHIASNQRQWTVTAHNDDINHCILSSDDQYIISASEDHTVKIWELLTGNLRYTLEGHTDSVVYCSLSADNQILLSTSKDNDQTIRTWSMQTGQCTNIFRAAGRIVWWAQLYHQNRRFVSAGSNVKVWNVETNQCVFDLYGHTGTIYFCNISKNEQFLLSASHDTRAKVWELATGLCIQTFHDHTFPLKSGCFVHKDTRVVTIDYSYTLCIWRISDAQCLHQCETYYRILLHRSYWLKWRDTEFELIIVSTYHNPFEVQFLDIESGGKIFIFTGHSGLIRSACVSSDGRFLIAGSTDGTMRMFVFSDYY